jgi:hypothetical protein
MNKSLFAFAASLFFAGTTFAQTAPTDSTVSSTTTTCSNRTLNWLARHDDNFEISLGFNALNGAGGPELRTGSSRFVSLGLVDRYRLVKGNNVGLVLRTGVEVSWYNFMLEGNQRALNTPTGVEFVDTPQRLRKSKLTAAYLNLPLTAEVAFRRGMVKHIGLGGYAGYRIAGYAKTSPEGGRTQREHGSYGLENVRYGLTAELALRHFTTLFVQYDLNPLFRENRGPNVTALSFGVRL